MHKKFLWTLAFIVGMTLTLGASPTIAMDDEETPLTNHSKKKNHRTIPSTKKESGNPKDNLKTWPVLDQNSESTLLKKSIKHIEPGCCQSVQAIKYNSRWKPWKLDEPYYKISDYTSGCGTFYSIFCCFLNSFFCCTCENRGGCYFNDDDLMCFDTYGNHKKDTDGEGKVMTRRDALRVMDVVNREMLEYFSNNPNERVHLYQPTKVNLTPYMQYQSYSNSFTLAYHASAVSDGPPVNLGRMEEIKEYERNLKAKGMKFVAHDLD